MDDSRLIWKIEIKHFIYRMFLLILFLILPMNLDAQNNELIKLSKTEIYIYHAVHEISTEKITRLKAFISTVEQITDLVAKYPNLQELHLELSCKSTIILDALSNLKSLKILTISYVAANSERLYNTCGFQMEPLNLAFIQKIEGLHFFGLKWDGPLLNAQHILNLKNLKICAIPSLAFDPDFLKSENSLHQLILGETVSLLRDEINLQELVLDCSDFSNQFEWENKNYRNFLKWNNSNFVKNVIPWQNSLVDTNENGDTIFFISTQNEFNTKWEINNYYVKDNFQISLKGSVNQDTISKQSFSDSFEMTSISIRDSLFEFSWNLRDNNYYSGVPNITQITYKNNLKDREFVTFSAETIFTKKVYLNDTLIYLYPYLDSVQGVNLIKDYLSIEGSIKEIFYGDSGSAIIRGYADYLAFDDDKWIYSIPVTDNLINGNVIVRSIQKDTFLIVSFKNGQLHGPFYYKTRGIESPTVVKSSYFMGQLDGEMTKVRSHSTFTAFYDKGKLFNYYEVYNETGTRMSEKIWSLSKKYFEVTEWHPNGQISREFNITEMGVIIGKEIFYDTNGKVLKTIFHD